jgi:outer membrane protein assembly factor BamB
MIRHRLAAIVACGLIAACSSGGGDSAPPTTANAPWPRFRRDSSNTGAASGSIAKTQAQGTAMFPPQGSDPLDPIASSPVIGADHTVYFATEGSATSGGTLYAVTRDSSTDRTMMLKWSVAACVLENQPAPIAPIAFGKISATPALTAALAGFPLTAQNDKILYFGDDNGRFFAVQDTADGPQCLWVYPAPEVGDDQSVVLPTIGPIVSSAIFTFDSVEQQVTGIFFGSTDGNFYALNGDGTLKWRHHVGAAIRSSPALDSGGPFYFTADNGNLYRLNLDGTTNIQPVPIGGLALPLGASPLRGPAVYVGTSDGRVVARTALVDDPSRGALWTFSAGEQQHFISALAITGSSLPVPTRTPLPTPPPTPSGSPTPTPTVTPSVQTRTFILAVASDGTVYVLDDSSDGAPAPGVMMPIPAGTTVRSSPAMSLDGCLVVGGDDGGLHIRQLITTIQVDATATPTYTPTHTPAAGAPTPTVIPAIECFDDDIELSTLPIRSSPAIDTDGVIYVGSDDGRLYRVGTPTASP